MFIDEMLVNEKLFNEMLVDETVVGETTRHRSRQLALIFEEDELTDKS